MNRLIKQLTDMGFPVSRVSLSCSPNGDITGTSVHCFVFLTYICITDASWFFLQRDPAEEALKSNNMNLDQAMSALLEKKTELDKRGMAITGHDYNSGLINKPMNCPRPPLLSKDPSADPRLPFMDKV